MGGEVVGFRVIALEEVGGEGKVLGFSVAVGGEVGWGREE